MSTDLIDLVSHAPAPSLPSDPGALVHALVDQLGKAGFPDELAASRRLLKQAEDLNRDAVQRRDAAHQRRHKEYQQLLAGALDLDTMATTVRDLGPWLDSDVEHGRAATMMSLAMDGVREKRGRAGALVGAEAAGIYQRLQAAAAEVVERVSATPALPGEV